MLACGDSDGTDGMGRPVLLAGLAIAAAAATPVLPAWPDTRLARLTALALLRRLNAALLDGDSATLTLERWCGTYRIAAEPRIVAEPLHATDRPVSAALRQLLRVGSQEPVRYRQVRLHCGAQVLCEAENWYVPSRLTVAMNRALETTDVAFGRAVLALQFRRTTLSARLLWSPLPQGRKMRPADAGGRLAIPPRVLEHRAVLSLPDGTPFSTVVESYTSAVLGFPFERARDVA